MFVENIMIPKHKCYTINHDTPLKEALKMLEKHRIDGLPVLNGNQYDGVLTRYNLYRYFFETDLSRDEYLETKTAKDVAIHRDIYLQGTELFERTLLMLKDFPLLAVVDSENRFLGAVTRFDVLEQFQSAFGMKKNGIRLSISSVESEGRLAKLSEIGKQYNQQIISLVTFDETDKLVRRIVIKIENRKNSKEFIKKLEAAGLHILSIHED